MRVCVFTREKREKEHKNRSWLNIIKIQENGRKREEEDFRRFLIDSDLMKNSDRYAKFSFYFLPSTSIRTFGMAHSMETANGVFTSKKCCGLRWHRATYVASSDIDPKRSNIIHLKEEIEIEILKKVDKENCLHSAVSTFGRVLSSYRLYPVK